MSKFDMWSQWPRAPGLARTAFPTNALFSNFSTWSKMVMLELPVEEISNVDLRLDGLNGCRQSVRRMQRTYGSPISPHGPRCWSCPLRKWKMSSSYMTITTWIGALSEMTMLTSWNRRSGILRRRISELLCLVKDEEVHEGRTATGTMLAYSSMPGPCRCQNKCLVIPTNVFISMWSKLMMEK